MEEQRERNEVDLSESSVYGGEEAAGEDVATEATLDRLETITGGADEPEPAIEDPELAEKLDELDAETEEEIDALKVNLMQEDERPDWRDGSGRVEDEVAEERIEALTETEPLDDARGARSLDAGSDDTSEEIRRHHPDMQIVDAEALVEGNVEETRDEELSGRDVA